MADELPPAPLSAYPTLKPGEPDFTLQGGNPRAIGLIVAWITEARADALAMPEGRDRDNLLVRATAAEEVLWQFQEYQKRGAVVDANEGQNPHTENSLDEKARLDLHDLRVRYAQKLSGMFSELTEMRETLLARGGFFVGEHDPLDHAWLGAIFQLKEMSRLVEPRRVMK